MRKNRFDKYAANTDRKRALANAQYQKLQRICSASLVSPADVLDFGMIIAVCPEEEILKWAAEAAQAAEGFAKLSTTILKMVVDREELEAAEAERPENPEGEEMRAEPLEHSVSENAKLFQDLEAGI